MRGDSPDAASGGLSKLVLKAALIFLIGSGVGLAYNAFSSTGIPLETPLRASSSEVINWELHLDGLRATLVDAKHAFDTQSAIFIDSRSPDAYAQGHIRGALNVPASRPIARAKEVLAGVSKDAAIITYCSGGGCRSSVGLARLLIQEFRFANTRSFHGGWPAWVEAGYPVTEGAVP
jgi:rhodanese-related sulfurtransferase